MRSISLFFLAIGACGYWMHAMVPIASLGASAFIGALLTVEKRTVPASGAVAMLVVAVFSITAGLTSAFHGADTETVLRVGLTPILAFAAVWLSRMSVDQVLFLVIAIGASSVAAGTLMYFQSGPMSVEPSVSRLLSVNRSDGYWLAASFFRGAPSIGSPLGVGAAICVAGAMALDGWRRVVLAALGAAALALLLMSLSRGATVGFVAATSAAAVLTRLRVGNASSSAGSIALAAMLAAVGYVAFSAAIEYIPGASVRYGIISGGLAEDRSMMERFEVWASAIALAVGNPFGIGYGYVTEGHLSGYSAHNEYIGTLVSGGVVGFLFLFALAIIAANRGISAASRAGGDAALLSLAGLSFCAVVGLTEHWSVSSSRLLYPVFWMLMAFVALWRNSVR